MAYEYTLDASAVLALFTNEPGAEVVAGVLDRSAISAVNLTEVITVLRRKRVPAGGAMARFHLLQIPVRAWDEDLSSASEQYAHLADQGLSLGDRACITEASVSGTSIVTADRAWKAIPEISDRVILIR
jgi:ribonuclease VapC